MIENVEQLCPELQVEPLLDFRVLDDGEIRVHEVWSLQGVSLRVARCAGARNHGIVVRSRRRGHVAEGARNREGGVGGCGAIRNRRSLPCGRSIKWLADDGVVVELVRISRRTNSLELIRP